MQIAIGILLIISALFLIVAVLMQQGKSHNLSGAIAGGAETFFGKEKGSTINNKLSKLTTVVAIVFALLVLVSYFLQDTVDLSSYTAAASGSDDLTAAITEALGDTVVDGAADTTAEEPAAEGEVTEP
ncbi:MAG: preprotein translocase subunit SecG [Clostridia bacterium]|nr:preprotein translocase subunit SecG [Clostridia bacterium]